jgi:hypothetical protein
MVNQSAATRKRKQERRLRFNGFVQIGGPRLHLFHIASENERLA